MTIATKVQRAIWTDSFRTWRLEGVVAFHDALNNFPGPIRVFVENILRWINLVPQDSFNRLPGRSFGPRTGLRFENGGCRWLAELRDLSHLCKVAMSCAEWRSDDTNLTVF